MPPRRPAPATLVLTAEKTPVVLRPYQQTIVDAAVEHFQRADRGQVIAACGSGKTLMGMRIAERLKLAKRPEGRRIMIAAPTLTLLKQAMDDWQADAEGAVQFVAVCSDKGVADDISYEDLGLEPTTDPAALRAFLAKPVPKHTTLVTLATYQSTPIVAEAMHEAPEVPAFDLAIADEAHRTAGEGASSPFRTIVRKNEYIGAIRATKRLFMTATPREIAITPRKRAPRAGRDVMEIDRTQVYSMDNAEHYGDVIYELTMAEAIAQGIIADYRIVSFPIRKSLLQFLTSHGADTMLPLAGLPIEEAASAYALHKAMVAYGIKYAITYHNRTADAKLMAERLNWFTATGTGLAIEADTINGTMPMTKRSRILERFKAVKKEGVRSVLTNAKALTEGVNVKAADAVLFADPKESLIEIVQALGRVLRKEGRDHEKKATIVIPMVVDDTDPNRMFVDQTSSDRMRQTLTELKLVDAKVLDRLEVYEESVTPEDQALGGVAREVAEKAAGAKQVITLREVIDFQLQEYEQAIRPVAPRTYHNVFWSDAAHQWLALVRVQEKGAPPRILLEQTFDDAEAAAHAVDQVLNEHGLDDWPRNFGRITLPPPRKAAALRTSAYQGVMFEHALERWVAHVRVHVEGRVVAALRYAETEALAARARDALAAKYGMFMPPNFPGEDPRFDLILLTTQTRSGQTGSRGIERDGVTGQVWGYARLGGADGRVLPLGFFATEEEARVAIATVEQRLATLSAELDYETLKTFAARAMQQAGVTPLTIAKRKSREAEHAEDVEELLEPDEAPAAPEPPPRPRRRRI